MPSAHKVYRFRLKPNQAQEQLLRQFAGARRWIWNWAFAKYT
jgi:Helix-turn-helix domain